MSNCWTSLLILSIQAWKDEFLTWDPAIYDNVKAIDVSSKEIWTSDFSLYNA